MLKILVTYAVQGEFVEIKWPDVEPYYIRTGKHWTEEGICNTGDGFLTELTHVSGDVVDMEAYAQAFVCRSKEIPFISVKYVTDIIGQNSVKHWEDKLVDARQGLSDYFNVLKERI